ncbi:MAG: putative beta-lysine N-acetyltransferase [Phycisphaerae bacterium]|nr:putative beta-lysine N-acetyltransferase [Phycisphaerae bacterium]
MSDKIETMGNSVIQHGPENSRIYLMKVGGADVPEIVGKLEKLAQKKSYSKIFAKVPLQLKPFFREEDYKAEAMVPGFYQGRDEAVFLAKFLSKERELEPKTDEISANLTIARSKAKQRTDTDIKSFRIKKAEPGDAENISGVFKRVFETYPFPVHDVGYIKDTMRGHICYFCAVEKDTKKIAAVSSAEIDATEKNVEMTDFATLPAYRGNGLAGALLERMESEMATMGIKKAYTIARALSVGVNILFARAGYEYAGTLINNTNICGQIESMNVWHKSFR